METFQTSISISSMYTGHRTVPCGEPEGAAEERGVAGEPSTEWRRWWLQVCVGWCREIKLHDGTFVPEN